MESKAELVERLNSALSEAPFVVLTSYRGATSNATNDIRRNLEGHGLRMEVVKNSLAKRALQGTGMEDLADQFSGMTGLIISGEDGIAAAKAIKEAIGDKKSPIQIKAGFFEGQVLDTAGAIAVASLPSREELLSLLLRTLQEAPRQVMGVIRAPARDLLYLLKNYEDKLAEQEGGE